MKRGSTLFLALAFAAVTARAGTTADPMPVPPGGPAEATEAQCNALKAGMKLVREVAFKSMRPEDGIHAKYLAFTDRLGKRDLTVMEGWRDFLSGHSIMTDPTTGDDADCSKVKAALPALIDEHKKTQAKIALMKAPCSSTEVGKPECRGDMCSSELLTEEALQDKVFAEAATGKCGKALKAALEQWGKFHSVGVNPYGRAERGSSRMCRAGQNGYGSLYDAQKQTGERRAGGDSRALYHTSLGLKEQADKLRDAWRKHLDGARRGALRRGINAAQTPLMDAQRAFYARHTTAKASDASMIQAGINASVAAMKLTETFRANCKAETQCMLYTQTMGTGAGHHLQCVSRCPAGSHAGVPGADGSSICTTDSHGDGDVPTVLD